MKFLRKSAVLSLSESVMAQFTIYKEQYKPFNGQR